jgi:hypothetical protein
MMGHHLDVVCPSCFGVEDKYLVKVEGGLSNIIELDWGGDINVRIINPNVDRV